MKTFDIRDFGAAEGMLCTEAIQRAIDAAWDAGGETVVIPAAGTSPARWTCAAFPCAWKRALCCAARPIMPITAPSAMTTTRWGRCTR